MGDAFEIRAIAHIHSDFPEKFGIPRQSGLVKSARSVIVFEEGFRNSDALRGIEGFSHLWLIWQFSENLRADWRPTVRPPRLGGNARMGVFATRSPFRPNSLGLSSVELIGLEHSAELGDCLVVGGADLMDGTPIFDIKPYIPYTDSHPEARGGFVDAVEYGRLSVDFPPELLGTIDEDKRAPLIGVLECDPRPQYHDDPTRIYKMSYGRYTVSFAVSGGTLTVMGVEE